MDTNSDLLEKLEKGEVKLHELDELVGEEKATKIRAEFIEKKLGITLEGIKSNSLSSEECRANIENMIGSTQVPLGITSPVKIKGEFAKGEFFIPLATTEGSLVASINRGCSAINKSGHAKVQILSDEQSRSLLFKSESMEKTREFLDWVESNYEKLKKAGESGHNFLEVRDIDSYVVGLNVWLRIKAYTHDAMGMNMITIAGKSIADYITDNFDGVEFLSESGNLCVDKKPSAMNLIKTRGKHVIASVEIDGKTVKEVLKTTPEKLVDMNYRKNLLGSAASVSLAFNAHFANTLAAIFIATGQDVAHTVDGSQGFTTVEKTDKGVHFSVTLPDLQVGTVGGGTKLKMQEECLRILGVNGSGDPPGTNSKKLAEITATAVLAGEISLLAALCTKDLSRAHQELNR